MNREPTVLIGSLAEIVRAIIPMLLIFGVIRWTDVQTGTVIFFVGVLVSVAEKLFIRSQVVPTDKANAQIKIGIDGPSTATVAQVIRKEENQANLAS